MTTYYVRTDGSDSNDGSADDAAHAWRTLSHAGATVAAGDTVMVRASAGNAASFPTSSPDYAIGGYFTPTAGTAAAGYVRWIGYNGIPTISCPGLTFYSATMQWFEGLYFVGVGTSLASSGIMNIGDSVVKNCIFNLNLQAGLSAINGGNCTITGCDIYGGSTSPTFSSGADGIRMDNYSVVIQGCKIRYCRGQGILYYKGCNIRDNLIYGNAGDGIEAAAASVSLGGIIGNTIHGNGGHGVNLSGSNIAYYHCLRNNIITDHVGTGKAGIYCASSGSDVRTADWGYNNVWNNTSNYTNCTAASTDFSVDPGYTDAANGDFTPSEATLLAAFPTSF